MLRLRCVKRCDGLRCGQAYPLEPVDDLHWRVLENDYGLLQDVDKDVFVVSTFEVRSLPSQSEGRPFYLVEQSLQPLLERASGAAAGYVNGGRMVTRNPQYFGTVDEACEHVQTVFPGNEVKVSEEAKRYIERMAVKCDQPSP